MTFAWTIQAKMVCNPHQSIINQKIKKISQPSSKALLASMMHDVISFGWPVSQCKCWVSSLFGPRGSGFHNGVDFAAIKGTPVYAAADGKIQIVEKSFDVKGYGNMILIDHEHGYKTRYAHLDRILIAQGDRVSKGQKIGTVGATGHVITKSARSDPSHLHFEIYRKDTRIDPLLVLFAADRAWIKKQI